MNLNVKWCMVAEEALHHKAYRQTMGAQGLTLNKYGQKLVFCCEWVKGILLKWILTLIPKESELEKNNDDDEGSTLILMNAEKQGISRSNGSQSPASINNVGCAKH